MPRRLAIKCTEVRERKVRTTLLIVGAIIAWGIILFGLCSCSHTGQTESAEKHQSAAISSGVKAQKARDVAQKAKDGQVANLAQQVRFLLSLPETAKTVPVADQLLDTQLTLTGPASGQESVLEAEVKDLLSSEAKNQETITRIQKESDAKQADLDDASAQIAKANDKIASTSSTLYAVASRAASVWDQNDHLWWIVYAFVVLGFAVIVLWALARFGSSAAVAVTAVAAKVP